LARAWIVDSFFLLLLLWVVVVLYFCFVCPSPSSGEAVKWEDLFHAVLTLRRALATSTGPVIDLLSSRPDALAAITSRKGVNNLRSTVSRNAVQLISELAAHSSERQGDEGGFSVGARNVFFLLFFLFVCLVLG
jgi:hypothetical protein